MITVEPPSPAKGASCGSSPARKPAAGSSASSGGPSAYKRGHSHKRSAAISGDFDAMGLGFFTQQPQPVLQPAPPPLPHPHQQDDLLSTPKASRSRPAWPYPTASSAVSANSMHRTPENKLFTPQASSSASTAAASPSRGPSRVPEALIDLDMALGVYYDPEEADAHCGYGSSRQFKEISELKNRIIHRRTESAPELEDFSRCRVFSGSHNGSQKNIAIFEEDEEDLHVPGAQPEDGCTHNSSSVAMLASLQSPAVLQHSSRRNNAVKSRYYNNPSILLNTAIKSQESLSGAASPTSIATSTSTTWSGAGAGAMRPPAVATPAYKPSPLPVPLPSPCSTTCSTVSSGNGPGEGFRFESRVYDVRLDEPETAPASAPTNYSSAPGSSTNVTTSTANTTTTTATNASGTTTTSIQHTNAARSTKTHKKSHSLMNFLRKSEAGAASEPEPARAAQQDPRPQHRHKTHARRSSAAKLLFWRK